MRICERQAGELSQSTSKTLVRWRSASRFAASAVLFALFALSHPRLLFGQQAQSSPLTLPQAVNIALEKNPQRKSSLVDTRPPIVDVWEPGSLFLPQPAFPET